MSDRGEKVTWDAGNAREVEPLDAAELKDFIKPGQWNDVVLVARGNHITYTINGHLMTELTDDSPQALKQGVIALQLHRSQAMEVRFKDIEIEDLSSSEPDTKNVLPRQSADTTENLTTEPQYHAAGVNAPDKRTLGNGPYHSVCFTRDGTRLLTASLHNGAELWDLATGKRVRQYNGPDGSIFSAVLSPDEKSVLTIPRTQFDGIEMKPCTARLWDFATGNVLRDFPKDHYDRGTFSPDGKRVLTVANEAAVLWDSAAAKRLFTFAGVNGHRLASFSPDGDRVLGLVAQDAVVWDAHTGKESIRIQTGPRGRGFESAQFSPNGELILTGSVNKNVRIWDVKTAQPIRMFKGHTKRVNQAVFADHGSRIVSCSSDRTVRIWDVKTGEMLANLENPGDVENAVLSPDGKRLIANWTIEDPPRTGATLWNVESGQEIRSFELPCKFGPNLTALSQDGKQIVVTLDREVDLYEATTGKLSQKY